MKILVNLFGGPGIGKSTTAAALFALAKKQGINAELCREYIKNWVWEERKVCPGDQPYITSKQNRRVLVLCRANVDLIISDSPVLLGVIYEKEFDPNVPKVVDAIYRQHQAYVDKLGYTTLNVVLSRHKPYVKEGRFHSRDEAVAIDGAVHSTLNKYGINYVSIDGSEMAPQNIMQIINKLVTNTESIV